MVISEYPDRMRAEALKYGERMVAIVPENDAFYTKTKIHIHCPIRKADPSFFRNLPAFR